MIKPADLTFLILVFGIGLLSLIHICIEKHYNTKVEIAKIQSGIVDEDEDEDAR